MVERKFKLLLNKSKDFPGKVNVSKKQIATMMKNLESLGFMLDKKLISVISTLSEGEVRSFYPELITVLKGCTGAKRRFRPMYPNFPEQVMEAPEAELYINAMMHYLGDWIGVRIMPDYHVDKREVLHDVVKLTVITHGTIDDVHEMFKDMMSANTSISDTDKEHLSWYLQNYAPALPDKMPHKEVLSFVIGKLLEYDKADFISISKYFKTATDVLRLATTLSGGDVSLAENTKFRNFKRSERRLMLELLNNAGNIAEDMKRYTNRWIRLGEKLHPGDYANVYAKVYNVFSQLRDNPETIVTFRTKVEKALVEENVVQAVELLSDRPGEFARRLDHLLRMAKGTDFKSNSIVSAFREVSGKVSTPVLLQVQNHFMHRNEGNELRVIFPKGSIAKAMALSNELPPIAKTTCSRIADACSEALVEKFKALNSLGKVYIDKELKNYIVPFSQRSASKALKTIVRGSRIPFPTGDTIRFFIWWKDLSANPEIYSRVDVDLSAVLFDKNWKFKEAISYRNLRSNVYHVCHSGDITSAPNGACEFMDLDIEDMVQKGLRYVMMTVLCYNQQSFVNLPECFAGWMMRQDVQSGEIFEPKTVQNKVDLTADTKVCIPMIMDLVKKEVIWTDLALKAYPSCPHNVENNLTGIALTGKAMAEMHKANLYDLFMLHAEARGIIVNKAKDADTVFSVTEGITPYDIEKISSEYLT